MKIKTKRKYKIFSTKGEQQMEREDKRYCYVGIDLGTTFSCVACCLV